MTSPTNWKSGRCLEWNTQLPLKDRPEKSNVFILQDVEYYFYFCRTTYVYPDSKSASYNLFLKSKAPKPKSFSFTIYVNYGAREFTCYQATYSNRDITGVFSFPETQITRSNVRLATGFPIVFFFVFENNLSLHLPSDIKTEDRSMQTVTYLNDNTCFEGLQKDISNLLGTELNPDVEIICGQRLIKAHKMVMCMRSKVFREMLQNNMQEDETGVIKIEDVDCNYIQDFIHYLYTDAMPELTLDNALALYEAGDKYIKSLMHRCSEYLQDNLASENAYRCYFLADAHSDQKLKDKITSYILNNKVFLQYEYWEPFCENFPKVAIEIYKLSHQNDKVK